MSIAPDVTTAAGGNGEPKAPPTPRHDPDQTRAFLEALELDFAVECVEMRILKAKRKHTGFITTDDRWSLTTS